MKITLKLSKEEAEAFKNFSAIKPDEVTDEQFYKHIFFTGCRTLNDELKRMFEANKDSLKAQKEEAMSRVNSEVPDPSDNDGA